MMANLFNRLRSQGVSLPFEQWLDYFNFNGLNYPVGLNQTLNQPEERIGEDFPSFVQSVYKQNGIVFACMLTRQLLFQEARFQFRRRVLGRPGEMFGTAALQLLENPWPGATTGDLLGRMIQDTDLAGNFFAARRPGPKIERLRPDWVTIIRGSNVEGAGPDSMDSNLVGYMYHEGGHASGKKPVPLLPEEVAHFAPIPDPLAHHRGMSWISPVLREIMGDQAATTHKLNYFQNGATPNLVVSFKQKMEPAVFKEWIEMFEQEHEGAANAYKTLYLGQGADATVVGSDLKAIDFKDTQGAGETRIAAAAGVPPVIVGLSEGLAAATYSNYGQARRRFADGTMRPLWRGAAACLSTLINVPTGSDLWYDDRDISFLQEDRKDAAEIRQADSQTVKSLVEAGFEPASVIAAVDADDMSRLKHTGLVSVQLQPPGTDPAGPADPPSAS